MKDGNFESVFSLRAQIGHLEGNIVYIQDIIKEFLLPSMTCLSFLEKYASFSFRNIIVKLIYRKSFVRTFECTLAGFPRLSIDFSNWLLSYGIQNSLSSLFNILYRGVVRL